MQSYSILITTLALLTTSVFSYASETTYGPNFGSSMGCTGYASFLERDGAVHYSLNVAGAAVSDNEQLLVGAFVQSVVCLYSDKKGAAWFGVQPVEGRMIYARSFDTGAEFIVPILELKQSGFYGRGLVNIDLPIQQIVKANTLQKMREGQKIKMIIRMFEAYPRSKSVIGSLNPNDYTLSMGYGQVAVTLAADSNKQNLPYKFTYSSLYMNESRP